MCWQSQARLFLRKGKPENRRAVLALWSNAERQLEREGQEHSQHVSLNLASQTNYLPTVLLEKHPSLMPFPLQVISSSTLQRQCHSTDQLSYHASYLSFLRRHSVPCHLCDPSNIQLAIKLRDE